MIKDGQTAKAWTLIVQKVPSPGTRAVYAMVQTTYNGAERAMHLGYLTSYDAKGSVAYSGDVGDGVQPIVQDSVGEKALMFVCLGQNEFNKINPFDDTQSAVIVIRAVMATHSKKMVGTSEK
jgi:hypothetical protein